MSAPESPRWNLACPDLHCLFDSSPPPTKDYLGTTGARFVLRVVAGTFTNILHPSRKIQKRVKELADQGNELHPHNEKMRCPLMPVLAEAAVENGMEIQNWVTEMNFAPYGIRLGKRIDDPLISKGFGVELAIRMC